MHSSKNSSSPLSLVINGYDKRGYGIASVMREDGFTYTARVFNAIEGEKFQVDSFVRSKEGKRMRDAINPLLEIVSPDRVEPKCSHFGLCGGCVFQHISIEHQKKMKEKTIFELFRSFPNIEFRSIIGVDEKRDMPPWEYRNKMEFSFAQDKQGKRFLGLYDRLGRGVINLKECHLVSPWVAKGVEVVLKWWNEEAFHLQAFHPRSGNGSLRTLTFREGVTTGDRMIIVTVSSKPEYAVVKKDLLSFQKRIQESLLEESLEKKSSSFSIVLRVHQAIPKKPTQIYEMMLLGPDYIRETITAYVNSKEKCQYTFHISPQAFFQPNSYAAGIIYSQALQLAQISQEDVVYDLYCGIGTFGMFAAKYAKKVIAIELSKDSSYDAKTNAERLGLSNFHIHCGDVGQVLEEIHAADQKQIDPIVIIDPPRSGLLAQAIEEIIKLRPKKIIYVSCNPEKQAEDIAIFEKSGLYRLSVLQPIDQFPHTPHIENIALIDRIV